MELSTGSALLREHRDAWLAHATPKLRSDSRITAASLWGSLARGNADDWSDVDLVVVVRDGELAHVTNELGSARSGFGDAAVVVDMPQNGLAGGGFLSVTYVDRHFPVHVDWYLCRDSDAAAWLDTIPLFARSPLGWTGTTFTDALETNRSKESRVPPGRGMTLSMIPIAVKCVVRESPGLAAVLELAGVAPAGGLVGHAAIDALRKALLEVGHEPDAPACVAFRALLDLAEACIGTG